MKKENIIFVDIDGPLLPFRQWHTYENAKVLKDAGGNIQNIIINWSLKERIRFDPVAVWMFNTWIMYSNVKIVLSTNWTEHTTTYKLSKLFDSNGLLFPLFRDDPVTPRKMAYTSRYTEIQMWLNHHEGEIGKYLIVDDDYTVQRDTLENISPDLDKFINSVVEVDYNEGLSVDNFYRGCNILDIDAKEILKDRFGKV